MQPLQDLLAEAGLLLFQSQHLRSKKRSQPAPVEATSVTEQRQRKIGVAFPSYIAIAGPNLSATRRTVPAHIREWIARRMVVIVVIAIGNVSDGVAEDEWSEKEVCCEQDEESELRGR